MKRLTLVIIGFLLVFTTIALAGVAFLPSLEIPGISNDIDCRAIPNWRSAMWYNISNSKISACSNGTVIDLSETSIRRGKFSSRPDSANIGDIYIVTDASIANDCNAGDGGADGGANIVNCQWNGAAWIPLLTDMTMLDDSGELVNPEVTTGSFIFNGSGPPVAGSCPHNKAIYQDRTSTGDTYFCYGEGQNWHLVGENDDSVTAFVPDAGGTVVSTGPTNIRFTGGTYTQTSGSDSDKTISVDLIQSTIRRTLDRNASQVAVVSNPSETSLYSFSVPGGTLGTMHCIETVIYGDFLYNSTCTVVFRFKYDTAMVTSPSITPSGGANRRGWKVVGQVCANAAANAQKMNFVLIFSNSTSASLFNPSVFYGTGAIDSVTNKTLDFTVDWSASDVNCDWTKEMGQVEYVP